MGLEKLRFRDKKYRVKCCFDWGYPQSVVALQIYRVGKYVPYGSRNSCISCVKTQLLSRIRLFQPVLWPVWPTDLTEVQVFFGGITSSSGIQIRHSVYAFRSYDEIYAMVKPNWQFDNVTQTGRTGLYDLSDRLTQIVQQTSIFANFGCQQYERKRCCYCSTNQIIKHLFFDCHIELNWRIHHHLWTI